MCLYSVAVSFLSLISGQGATLSRRAQLSLVSPRAHTALNGKYPLDILLAAADKHGPDAWTHAAAQLLATPNKKDHDKTRQEAAIECIAANLRYCYTVEPRPGQATMLAQFVHKRTFHDALNLNVG